MAWSAGSWGTWHTSSVIEQACPQGCGKHSVQEAVELNLREQTARNARNRKRTEEWLKK
jgi:hypothetical protein